MKKRTHSGFTLMELMVTLSIAAVVTGLAIPNISRFLKNNKMTGVANDVLTSLTFARNESIKRQQPVAMCATTTPKSPTAACSVGSFSSGWIVFVDTDNDGLHGAGETVLTSHDALETVITTRANNQYLVSYAATGFAQTNPGGRATTTNIAMCDDRHNTPVVGTQSAARGLTINQTGRARVTNTVSEITAVLAITGTGGNCT